MSPKCKKVADYWVTYYVSSRGLCSLCGNTGKIDTTGRAVSPAGVHVGRVNFCICPNGQAERAIGMRRKSLT